MLGTLALVGALAHGCGDTTSAGPGVDPPESPSWSQSTRAESPGVATPSEDPTPSASSPDTTPTSAAPATPTRTDPSLATTVLATLAVKGRAPRTGYSRDQFGPAWADVDHNGCDTRNDVLARDLTSTTVKSGSCLVLTGVLHNPYTGSTIHFVRGQGTSSLVQIDHVVALEDAWQKGAQQLSASLRRRLANDPLELLAVDQSSNGSKGAGDAATWLPPSKAYRCRYVARQVAVKSRYHLWVTSAERDAIARILSTCPGQTVPTGGLGAPAASAFAAAPRRAPSTPARTPSSAPVRIVHAGSFCSDEGTRGRTSAGTSMRCQVASDGRLRWKRG